MQQSMLHFCEECGAANAENATICTACQQPLSTTPAAVAVAPVKIAPAPVLQVVAGTPAPATAGPLKRGTLLAGRYRIERAIGQGGFGLVYKARDLRQHGRVIAIKQIDLNVLKPQEMIEATDSFNREVTLLSTLHHPNLPKFYAHFTDANHWYLAMEYINGQTLEDFLKRSWRGYLSISKALHIGEAVANVLSYLHKRRPAVIFRDVKPTNIMLTRTGRVYLIDFGIARRFSSLKSKDTGPLGSPGYAAPEQYGRSQSDQKTDMYGLGATLQTLLTGREPLELRLGEPSLRSKPLPAKIQTLLTSLLDADPAKRPADMATVAEDCKRVNQRKHNIFSFARGLLLGLPFPLSFYAVVFLASSVINTINKSFYDATVLLYGVVHLATFLTVLLCLIAFIVERKRNWVMGGFLVMLILTIILQFFNAFPEFPFIPPLF